jgi:hypothetical protein
MRSGSTLLKALLGSDASVSHLSEVDLFTLNKNQEELYEYLSGLSEHQYIVVKRPATFIYPDYPPVFLPEAKNIVLHRHPYWVVYSLRNMLIETGSTISTEPAYLLDHWVKVYKQLLEAFPPEHENNVYVNYEQLTQNPSAQTKRLFKFIGIRKLWGTKSYQKPKSHFWQWGSDDQGAKIESLSVQSPTDYPDTLNVWPLIEKHVELLEVAEKLSLKIK